MLGKMENELQRILAISVIVFAFDMHASLFEPHLQMKLMRMPFRAE
jgi:hypothetical protein